MAVQAVAVPLSVWFVRLQYLTGAVSLLHSSTRLRVRRDLFSACVNVSCIIWQVYECMRGLKLMHHLAVLVHCYGQQDSLGSIPGIASLKVIWVQMCTMQADRDEPNRCVEQHLLSTHMSPCAL